MKNFDDKNGIISDQIVLGDTKFYVYFAYNSYENEEFQSYMFYNNSEKKNAPGNRLHNHYYHEIFFIKDGELEIEKEGTRDSVKKNGVAILPANTIHATKSKGQCSFYSFGVYMKQLKNAGRTNKTYNLFKTVFEKYSTFEECGYILETFRKINEHLEKKYELRFFTVRTYLQEVILLISEKFYRENPEQMTSNSYSLLPDLSYAINNKMDSGKGNVTLKDVAEELFISERQLSRIIKKQYGMSFRERKKIIKIEKAKRLLIETDMTMEKIANEVLFSTVGNFTKTFKETIGCTPKEFREKNLKQVKAKKDNF